jgi:hypothetical protein
VETWLGLPRLYKNVGINKDPSRRHGPPMATLPTSPFFYTDMSKHIYIYIYRRIVWTVSPHASSLLFSSFLFSLAIGILVASTAQ